jgi:hypothetical protein
MPEEQNQPAIVELVIAEAALKKAEEFIEKELLERAYRKISAAKERLERLLERTSAQQSRICGILARPTRPSAHLGRRA